MDDKRQMTMFAVNVLVCIVQSLHFVEHYVAIGCTTLLSLLLMACSLSVKLLSFVIMKYASNTDIYNQAHISLYNPLALGGLRQLSPLHILTCHLCIAPQSYWTLYFVTLYFTKSWLRSSVHLLPRVLCSLTGWKNLLN